MSYDVKGDREIIALAESVHPYKFAWEARTRWPAALDEIERLQREQHQTVLLGQSKVETRLKAEIERLQCQLANQKAAREDFESLVYGLVTERDALKAENSKLLDAIVRLVQSKTDLMIEFQNVRHPNGDTK